MGLTFGESNVYNMTIPPDAEFVGGRGKGWCSGARSAAGSGNITGGQAGKPGRALNDCAPAGNSELIVLLTCPYVLYFNKC